MHDVSQSNSMKTPDRRRSRIRGFCALAAIVAGAGAAAPAHAAPAPAQADWTAVSANAASGSVAGTSVSLSGTHVWDVPVSRVDGSWPYFAGATFSPSLPKSDVIQISGAPGASYTIRFGGRVADPVLELCSLGSRLDFTAGTPVTKVSGESGFVVSGSSVSGTPSNTIGSSGNSDRSGAIKLTGTYRSITFKATPNYVGPEDGILVQLVTQADSGIPDLGTQQGSGECTDWALYRRPDLAGKVTGNAQDWAGQARTAGYRVSKVPIEGAVMVLRGGVLGANLTTGHVAYVESVQRDANGNATSFLVSEQNWNGIRSSTAQTIQVSSLPANRDGVDFILLP